MGMLVDGVWDGAADRSMRQGTYRREQSAMPTFIDDQVLEQLRRDPAGFVLVASSSCPWSHAAVLASIVKGFAGRLPVQMAGGPRVEGYAIRPGGPLTAGGNFRHMHQLYSLTDPQFTGRATVPVLWDVNANRILSNSSADIIRALNLSGDGADLFPAHLGENIAKLTTTIFDGLSNAVYRAGKAQRQDEYDQAADTVFDTLAMLETRLADQQFLFGSSLTETDIRLFATLVRFDTVYATHFRLTRKRLVDYKALWRFTRQIYQLPGIRATVDFDEIRSGYYINDGSHNPFGIIGQQPEINWDDRAGLQNCP